MIAMSDVRAHNEELTRLEGLLPQPHSPAKFLRLIRSRCAVTTIGAIDSSTHESQAAYWGQDQISRSKNSRLFVLLCG